MQTVFQVALLFLCWYYCVCFFPNVGLVQYSFDFICNFLVRLWRRLERINSQNSGPSIPRCSMSVFPKQSCLLCSFTFLFCSINHHRRRCPVGCSARWSSPSLLPGCNSAAKLVTTFRAGGPSQWQKVRHQHTCRLTNTTSWTCPCR